MSQSCRTLRGRPQTTQRLVKRGLQLIFLVCDGDNRSRHLVEKKKFATNKWKLACFIWVLTLRIFWVRGPIPNPAPNPAPNTGRECWKVANEACFRGVPNQAFGLTATCHLVTIDSGIRTTKVHFRLYGINDDLVDEVGSVWALRVTHRSSESIRQRSTPVIIVSDFCGSTYCMYWFWELSRDESRQI